MQHKNKSRTHRITAFLKKCWIPLALCIITAAVIVTMFRALTPWAKHYKGDVETHLSTLLGQKVTINSMETSWYWLEPVVKLNDVVISDPDGQSLKLNQLLIGINMFSSLRHWEIKPGVLYINDVHLSIRQGAHSWHIDGISHLDQKVSLDADTYSTIITWLASQQKVVLRNVSALIHLDDKSIIPLSNVNLTIANQGTHYFIKGTTSLTQTIGTHITVQANLNIDANKLSQTSGKIYLESTGFIPEQWQGLLKKTPFHIEGGQGSINLWLDFSHGNVNHWQSEVNFEHLAWRRLNHSQSQLIQSIKANVGWERTHDGWLFNGNNIQLRADGINWPDNAVQMHYFSQKNQYKTFIKHLLIKPLLASDIAWPKTLHPLLVLKPAGTLHDTQVQIEDNEIHAILSRFNNIAWHGDNAIPSVTGLSGALYWQPHEGRLDLDSKNTTITLQEKPLIALSSLGASLDWKQLSHGTRFNLANLVLINPELTLTANGVLDKSENAARDHLSLHAKYSAEQAQKWFDYLPPSSVKPTLDRWLKHNIKKIGKLNGQLVINGRTDDFPFDKTEGEFTVLNHLSDVDFLIAPGWPMSNQVEAYMRFDKRSMNTNIVHANLHGLLIGNTNIRIDDIGLNHETLLLHSNIGAPAEKIKNTIFTSPLKKHLSRLKPLTLHGLLGLDFQLEIPLYPENNTILSQGIITFNNNQALIHHDLTNITLQNITGSLDFNEQGILDSAIKTSLAGHPVFIKAQTHKTPTPHTEITMQGQTSAQVLRNTLKLPIFNLMKGQFALHANLTLTDDPHDLDHLKVTSSLEGLAINLPPPLGKKATARTPLSFDVNFNPEQALRLRIDYNDKISSDLWFQQQENNLHLDKGEIRLGSGRALWQKQPGVQIIGSLPCFNLTQWRETFSKLSIGDTTNSIRDSIAFIDLKLNEINLFNQMYTDVHIKAHRIKREDWAIQIKQKNIGADLRYQLKTNTLSGNLPYLTLSKTMISEAEKENRQSHINPTDIPNLNLVVEQFIFNKINVGSMTLKSSSTKHHWQLHESEITSPTYTLNMKGEWTKDSSTNHTAIQTHFQFKNLKKTLKQWNLNPAIEAKQGKLLFNGGWPGSITDFSLKKLTGDMEIIIQDGRIPHVSPDAEQKIGIGKLLSILSLQTIPRRLKLDFSDLAKPGYSFDKFSGTFIIKNGNMTTQDSTIDGPVAFASMKGDLNMAKQLYDIDLHVSPHITASLPVVATIAGGPIAGLATWVASKIISKSMQKVTGYTYKITGPWDAPVVQQLQIYRKQKQ